MSFDPDQRAGLTVTGYYATQYLIDRAYGNYLGLCRLGQFVAHEIGQLCTRMICIAAVARLGNSQWSKAWARDQLEPLHRYLDEAGLPLSDESAWRCGEMSGDGRLIVIEGPDGVGKSTLTEALVARLRALGVPCHACAFPGNTPGTLGSLVYRLHRDPAELGVERISTVALQALHIAAHLDAISHAILPRLNAGEHIIIDRYWWSTWAYGLIGGVSEDVLKGLIEAERQQWGSTSH